MMLYARIDVFQDGFTPLAVALQEGRDGVVDLLLEKDNTGKVKLPSLHITAKKDDAQAAILMLRHENKAETAVKVTFLIKIKFWETLRLVFEPNFQRTW